MILKQGKLEILLLMENLAAVYMSLYSIRFPLSTDRKQENYKMFFPVNT